MEKEELAKQYRIQQYIDFGDLNEKAEQQIEQAFIDGYEKALSLFSVSSSNGLSEIAMSKVKGVVIEVFNNRKQRNKKEIEKYGELSPMIKKSCEVENLMLGNLQTEICVNLDKEFESSE